MIYTVTLNPSLDRTLTVPHIEHDEMVRATASRVDWGGKGFNVSRVLQVLGAESIAMGFAGGATGQMLERGLRGLGISTDLVSLSGETRTNTVVIESETGRYIKVNEPGPIVQPDEQAALLDRIRRCLQSRKRRARRRDLWVLSGSLPPGLPDGFYADLVEMVQATGARALLDASGEPLRLGCAAAPFLVKPNVAEALGFVGITELAGWESSFHPDSVEAADRGCIKGIAYAMAEGLARPFLDSGVELVALSLGAGGLLLTSAEWKVMATPPRVQARNPVGAGDALLAAVAWALERDLPLEEMARWGVAAGTAAAMGEGVAVATHAEVQALYEQITPPEVMPVVMLDAQRQRSILSPPTQEQRRRTAGFLRETVLNAPTGTGTPKYDLHDIKLPPPLMTSESGSFARKTIVERKPQIIDRVIADNDYTAGVVKILETFKQEIASQPARLLVEDAPGVASWNRELVAHRGRTWLELPWYFAEAYFYRRLLEAVGYFQPGPRQERDPFGVQKRAQIASAVARLAEGWEELASAGPDRAFEALLHSSLWGNRADLSNYTVSLGASGGLAARDERHNIIIDHTERVRRIVTGGIRRVDFVNDNVGLDSLFDLALSDLLLRQGWVERVVCHLKDHPFFVSDAMPQDLRTTVSLLATSPTAAARALGERLCHHIDTGDLALEADPFWTSHLMFRDFPLALRDTLACSDLVILKGDVNYRRLLDDRHWPYTTPLEEIATYFPAPLLVLRTLKGEIQVGLEPGQAEALAAEDAGWLINGQRGLVQYNHPPDIQPPDAAGAAVT